MTGFYKRVFPKLWVGFLAVVLIALAAVSRRQPGVPMVAFVVPLLMMVLGYFLFRKLLFDLMDEVWDDGKELLVVNDGHVEHLPFSDIVNVSYAGLTNPKRVTLSLRRPGRWGAKLTFSPPMNYSFAYLTEHPLVEDLIRRADEARRAS
ncbi:MAG TPA: hypothetical protein VGH91_08555 [Gammaproteobacteria bacterium]